MKILVIQLRRIGDVLLTTSVLPYLKKEFPDCTIDFLCEPCGKQVAETNPHIRKLHIYDKSKSFTEILSVRREKYDAVFDFMANPRSGALTLLSGAKFKIGFKKLIRRFCYNVAMPIPIEPEYVPMRKLRLTRYGVEKIKGTSSEPDTFLPQLFFSESDIQFAEQWMKNEQVSKNGFVGMASGLRHPVRQWKPDGYREVALKIYKEYGLKTFLSWGPGEEPLMQEIEKGSDGVIKRLPATTLRQMAAIFKNAKFVLTNDSGNMHVTVAAGTPTVTIYGPTRPVDWNPSSVKEFSKQNPHIAVTAKNIPCLGCHLLVCPIGLKCMSELSANEVFEASKKILSGVY